MAQRIIDRSYVGEVLQHVYSSEFRVSISLMFTGGYFYLETEGLRVPLQGTNIEEAVTDLASRLTESFPTSKFAAWWLNHFRDLTGQ